MPSQVRAAQVTRCLVSLVAPSWGVRLIASPVPAARFSGCTTGAPSQACRMSLLGSLSLAATLPADVDHPESQEVLVSSEAYLQFGRGCLFWGPRLPLPSLAALTCLSPAGGGPVCSRLALFSPLFCERAWPCLRLGLFAG